MCKQPWVVTTCKGTVAKSIRNILSQPLIALITYILGKQSMFIAMKAKDVHCNEHGIELCFKILK